MFVFDVFLCLYDVIYDVTNPLQNMEIDFFARHWVITKELQSILIIMWLFPSQDSTKYHNYSHFIETQKDRESTFRLFTHFEQENWLKLFVEKLP